MTNTVRKNDRVPISVNVPVNLLERIDTFATHRGINRTAAIMVLVSSSLDEFDKTIVAEKE